MMTPILIEGRETMRLLDKIDESGDAFDPGEIEGAVRADQSILFAGTLLPGLAFALAPFRVEDGEADAALYWA